MPQGVIVLRAELPDNTSEEAAKRFDQWFVIRDNPELSGAEIENPEQNFDQRTQEPIVTMEFTDKGRDAFQEVTRRIAQRGSETLPTLPEEQRQQHFAISLDNELVSRPLIDFVENPDGIDGGGGAQISGGFTISSAQDLAEFLKIGALPVKLELISRSTVSASLGKQALDQGLIAGLVGFGIVALFLLVFYRVLGVIAVAALGVYALYFFALVKLVPVTLTLPGIAGLILTIGVAADANIVVFERIKEEVRAGRSVAAGIAQGYKKGFGSIIDANIVTLLVAFILFILATAGVKGFAFMLGIGVFVSLFTAVLATQAILLSLRNSKLLSKPSALGAGKEKRPITFDFMGASKWFFSLSGVILLICAMALAGKGIDFGIDFESGTRIKTPLEKPADADDIRSLLEGGGFNSPKVQTLNDPELGANVVQVSIKKLGPDQVDEVKAALDRQYGVVEASFSSDSIGPTFGETIATSAIRAIIASLFIIAIYLTLRFQWKFAVPVLIALLHDLMITAGVYALVDREVTTATVAALLTIMGFSLYDTIIVFDRIRENEPRMPSATFAQVVNRSMSEVIVRSIATSFCALLPVLSLFFFGGDTLKDFAFALIVGTLSGTYSSVFIAGPVLTHWKQREPVYKAREARIRDAFGGVVPAYLTAAPAGLGPVDIGPQEETRRRSRLTSPADPSQGVSKEEFDQMVAELDVESPKPAAAAARGAGTGASAAPRGGRRARRAASGGAAPPSPPSGDGGKSGSGGDGGDGSTGSGTSSGSGSGSGGGGSKSRKTRRHGRPR